MALKYINNGITYNNVVAPGKSLKAVISINGYKNEAGEIVDDDYNGQIVEPTKFINAIDIDWNGAELAENVIISDTSDLLNNLKGKANASDVYTKEEADAKYLTEHQDISGKANIGDSYTKEESDAKYLAEHQDISGKANVGDSYTKEESDAKYLTEHQDISGKANVGDSYTKEESDAKYLTEHQSLTGLASETYVNEQISALVGSAPQTLDTLEEIATALQDNATMEMVTNAISTKANVGDSYTKEESDAKYLTEHQDISHLAIKTEIEETYATQAAVAALADNVYTKEQADAIFQPKGEYLTEHQDISHLAVKTAVDTQIDQIAQQLATHEQQAADTYATKSQVEAIVGTAPENFDTLEELADVMKDLKVVDQEAIEGEKYTQEEIDAAVEGDDAYGKTTDDWKVEPVEEVSHNMSISEFVTTSMEAVNEKPEIETIKTKYSALLSLLNLRDTDVNNVVVNQALATSNNVTFDDGVVDNITVPETTKTTTVTTELDTNSTLNLTSPKSITINNTGTEPTNLAVNAPAEGSTPTVTLKSGNYDTVTIQDASLTVSNDATIQNVVITPETTKATTINATFVEGATITSNSEAPITVTNKNTEGEEVSVTLNAPGSTVTLSGGKWTTISGEVSENTLIIKGSAKIQSLNLTKGNVIVEVPREEDIKNVISGEITLGEGYTITHRKYDITNENSSKLGGIGEMILQEDITRTSSIVAPLAPAYNAVWNLNGHNITVEGTPKSGVYLNRYTSNIEVKGNGTIHCEGSYGLWNSGTTGKIIVNDGVTVEAQTHAIYAEKGIIEINGGSFKLTNAATADKDQNGNFKFLLNCYDANYNAGTANIIVKGGKFYGFNPAESYGEQNGPVSFVAEGYESVPTNEEYEFGTVYEVRKIAE